MKKSILVLILFFTLGACKLEEINQNPNVPNDVPLSTILPGVENAMAEVFGGRIFVYSNIFAQTLEGRNNQELNVENYNPDELFVGYIWEDIYTGPMNSLNIIIQKAEESNSPHYAGVAKVLMANCLGVCTDLWGDVPFSEALDPNNVQPIYDSQAVIYDDLERLLSEAIVDLNEEESVFSPGSDDIIYLGNLQHWIAAAHALKAKYAAHQVPKDLGKIDVAINEANVAMLHQDFDLQYAYLGTEVDANPIYQYYEITPNAVIDPQFIGVMGVQDPRFDYFIDIIPFTGGESKVGAGLASPDSPIKFVSYAEMQFILAEMHARNLSIELAQSALQNGVRASLEENTLGELDQSEIDDFVTSFTLGNDLQANLELILEQKFIALFTQMEIWTDWRRTGIPSLSPNDQAVSSINPSGEIPRRFNYPINERLLNSNFPSNAPSLDVKMWWEE